MVIVMVVVMVMVVKSKSTLISELEGKCDELTRSKLDMEVLRAKLQFKKVTRKYIFSEPEQPKNWTKAKITNDSSLCY